METTETADTGAIRSKLYEMGFRFPLRFDLILQNHVGFRRLAETFGEGSLKYPPGNWMKGFQESVYINHAMEHLRLYLAKDTTEDHLAHALWNLYALTYVQEKLPHLLDLTGQEWPPVKLCEPMGAVQAECEEQSLKQDEVDEVDEAQFSVHFFPVKPTWHEEILDGIENWNGPSWYIICSDWISNQLGNHQYAKRETAILNANQAMWDQWEMYKVVKST